MIWLVHLIYSAVGFALCYNYVILSYTGMFPVGDTSCRKLIAVYVCVCLSADISLNCAKND